MIGSIGEGPSEEDAIKDLQYRLQNYFTFEQQHNREDFEPMNESQQRVCDNVQHFIAELQKFAAGVTLVKTGELQPVCLNLKNV